MTKIGSKVVLDCLVENGVSDVFGYPGGAIMPLYDELFTDGRITHYRTAHEQGAVHAADGYARSTGKLGVVFVTSGPGATNTITGLATANLDSVPMLIITGQVPRALLGRDSFQEVDIVGISEAVTKASFLVEDAEKLAFTLTRAIEIAISGRPGPVLVDIPKDIFTEKISGKQQFKVAKRKIDPPALENLEELLALITKAKRPLIYTGGGVKQAGVSDKIKMLSEKLNIPVVNTLMGLGTIDREHDHSLGMVGMHGTVVANKAVMLSDLLIVVGVRFSDRSIGKLGSFAPQATILHLDIDETEFDKNVEHVLSVLGDVNITLDHLITHSTPIKHGEWFEELRALQSESESAIDKDDHPKQLIKMISQLVPEDTIVVTDVGQHQMWTAQAYSFKQDKGFLTSGGLGTMGYGLGAAIGAKVGNPEKPVLLITGDGSFGMNHQELMTVRRYGLSIMIVLMNNEALGMVRQWQKLFYDKRYTQTCNESPVDYQILASAYGIRSGAIKSVEDLKLIEGRFKKTNEAMFIECKINREHDVYPIVPPGKAIDEYMDVNR
ncbi:MULTISPECIES: biosynthetic-type acetolactate synthase large subunit [unclassified Fusibacter]|uniref:biosynthetic-type acetolactate synthase large subunit n=1 Tax=unclassified Fusibacter TaxID=2624464 RepID=UPI001012B074|nr:MULTISPECIES: biosynthetic-type acetolactate synthase large subunit [unclassified Fusibacter]MCK8059184.1 biosynthetic-type acetolactate synthase large subunit [Fusibacter sp. A2]NPE22593.1 biosynthetic-type acetolactate synthase large subunit [Fusibacter sp. A1]RXV60694.1 biosynthetic-type acetolactate synthase large subunit [Fusibacter sp. A1]